MAHYLYPVAIAREGPDYVVTVRDLPPVVTSGPSEEAAREMAADAVQAVVEHAIENELDIAEPSDPLEGEILIGLPAQLAAKLAVYQAWRRSGIRKAELARRMNRNEVEVRRILNPRYGTKLDQLEEAARALGGRLDIRFEAA
ncbi:type II toxin-antitoxin system HicB family antitoxin [Labrys wisconsinensis]|uniref:Antitoxin HicB n=1 Tax=Labrys wisconsinensis TaxID=425677 RepID=A0ABU0JGX0_9HYPH|nr:type II toxin-antitoxin system HicB family antitoxin [Labrys wisconsinensis]MDQ0472830.1 antitoxin HicB [Labrys wisconsinensis]